MPLVLTVDDLAPFLPEGADQAKVSIMIEDAAALAARVAPCLATTTDESVIAAAKAIVRGAIIRWWEAGTGAIQSETRGPYSLTLDTRSQRKGMFWPAEITDLQGLCGGSAGRKAFGIDTGTVGYSPHADICALNFGAVYCSCGADLTNLVYPLWET